LAWSSLSLAPFVPTPPEVVRTMLRLAELKKDEVLYDLGCGDGRILVIAAQEFGAQAVGVELNLNLVREGREKISSLDLENRVKIIHGNILETDISPADLVTLYLTTSANEKVKPKMEQELRTGARIVSHDFGIPGWKPAKIDRVQENYRTHTIYMYVR